MATPLTTAVPPPCFSCLEPRCETRPSCSSRRRPSLTAAALTNVLPCLRQLCERQCWRPLRDDAPTSLLCRLFMLSSSSATLGSMDKQEVQLGASGRAISAGYMVTLTNAINES